MTINSFILAIHSMFFEKIIYALWLVPIFGIIISLALLRMLKSYAMLNSAKFKVINSFYLYKQQGGDIMSKEKDNCIQTKEDTMQIDESEKISNMLSESIKPILENIASMNKTLESINVSKKYTEAMNETTKYFETVGHQFNQIYKVIIESIQPILNVISNIKFPKLDIDFSEFKIYFYRNAFEEKEAVVNILYSHTIFPPILYLIENDIEEKSIDNLEEWVINNKKLKLFYIDRINKWKYKYSDDNIKRMIDEIKFNLEHSNSYSVCTLVGVLIEYMLKQNYSDKIKSNGGIYYSIKNVLKEKVFHPIDIEKLYIRFIEENLYASTKSAKEFSRHITHGEKIEFGNMKSAMNMIFIYDFLQDVMIVNEN